MSQIKKNLPKQALRPSDAERTFQYALMSAAANFGHQGSDTTEKMLFSTLTIKQLISQVECPGGIRARMCKGHKTNLFKIWQLVLQFERLASNWRAGVLEAAVTTKDGTCCAAT